MTRLWPGETFICLGCGPSLTQADVDACKGRGRVIAVNDSHRLAPLADVLHACDGRWWDFYQGVPEFAGLKFGVTVKAGKWPGVERLRDTGVHGFELALDGVRTGGNSGYQAIQVAAHLGAARILLLGYDMQAGPGGRDHWFGRHPSSLRASSPYDTFRRYFIGLKAPLAALGIEVVNCTPGSALTCFSRQALAEALEAVEVTA